MEILKDTPYRDIPSELFHYTSIDNFESIVQGNNEDGEEICFWAFSSECKNDEDELKYGQKIYEWVRQKNRQEYLPELPDKCYLLSFSEGNSFDMIERYGCIRLGFDLTNIVNSNPSSILVSNSSFLPCDYRDLSELNKYADLFIEKYENLFNQLSNCKKSTIDPYTAMNLLLESEKLKFSLANIFYTIKDKNQWEIEKEWRMIIRPNDTNVNDKISVFYSDGRVHINKEPSFPVFHSKDGRDYIKIYFPIKCLKSICLFNTDKIDSSKSSYLYKEKIDGYLRQHNWQIPIFTETYYNQLAELE